MTRSLEEQIDREIQREKFWKHIGIAFGTLVALCLLGAYVAFMIYREYKIWR